MSTKDNPVAALGAVAGVMVVVSFICGFGYAMVRHVFALGDAAGAAIIQAFFG